MPNRQLAIYDFASQPIGLGDFYIFLQASLSLSAHHGIDEVDLCLVCEPSRMRIPEFVHLKPIEGGLRAKIFDLLPITQLHPRLRSVFLVDRLEHAVDLARRPHRPYRSCWPPYEMLASGTYLYYPSLLVLHELHAGRAVSPHLRARPAVADWAARFLLCHGRGGVPVSVNLRNNPAHGARRNMDAKAWRDFFDRAADRHDATFFLLGAPTEDFSCFRSCTNVVFTKDWNTAVEQDLALIEQAGMHLGSPSGPSIFPVFIGDKPTLIVNGDALPHLPAYQGSATWDGTYLGFTFGSRNYRSTVVPETAEFLLREFSLMMDALAQANAPLREAL